MNKKDYLETLKLLEKEISKLAALVSFEIEKVNSKHPKEKVSSSPVSPINEDTSLPAFIQFCIEISPNTYVLKEILYDAYLKFCFHKGIKNKLKRQTFCTKFPTYFININVHVHSARVREGQNPKERFRVFKGVTLKTTTN
ncbi:MAG: primase-like DNA-binding domain-containing protein [Sphingobacteriaceae bacterium]